MPKVYALTCPHCRAPLPAIPPGTATVVCEYCGKSSNVSHTMHMPAAEHPRPAPPPQARSQPQAPPPRGGQLAVRMFAVVLVIGVMIAIAIPMVSGLRRQRAVRQATRSADSAERMMWAGGPLVTTDIDGDGDEDLVGMFRVLDSKSELDTYVGGFTSKGWKRVWQTGKLGSSAEVNAALGVAGDAIVFVDNKGVLHVLDRKTGAERKQIVLTDRAESVCTTDATHAWIRLADETSVLADLVAGGTTPAPRPATCPAPTDFAECSSWDSDDDATPTATCVTDAYNFMKAPDMHLSYAVQSGAHAVAVGTKAKGTTISMIAGYDSARLKEAPLWVRRVYADPAAMNPTGDVRALDIVGDAGFLAYALDSNLVKLQRFDAATGVVQWESTVPGASNANIPDTLLITDKRIYAPHWTTLDIFDVKTGTHLQTIGK